MQALRHEILPPSGVEFTACLNFTPSTVPTSSIRQAAGRVLFNVVVARSNLLRVYEVREEPAPISSQKDDERERRASVRKGTEAVEGEVEMDASGEGYVNMGSAKVNSDTRCIVPSNSLLFLRNEISQFAFHNFRMMLVPFTQWKLTVRYIVPQSTGQNSNTQPPKVNRFYFLREHRLHGIVTGMERVRTVTSQEDKLDRLLISFKDAKVGLSLQDFLPSRFSFCCRLLYWNGLTQSTT